jgi:hypothetical protein
MKSLFTEFGFMAVTNESQVLDVSNLITERNFEVMSDEYNANRIYT